jgi:hypothetical protein
MKIRIRRVAEHPGIGTWGMDDHYINAGVTRLPKKGERIQVLFDCLGKGSWSTTPVVGVRTLPGVKVYSTESGAEYWVKKGWAK